MAVWFILSVCLVFFWLCDAQDDDIPSLQVNWTVKSNLQDSFLNAYQDHPMRAYANLNWLSYLQNRTIIFIGDSLTRYQYQELITFLYRGQHIDLWGVATIKRTRENYLFISTYHMGCQEIIDGYWGIAKFGDGYRENRYFHHFELNLTISFFFYAPPQPLAVGLNYHPNWQLFHDECIDKEKLLQRVNLPFVPSHRKNYSHIHEFITLEIQPLSPDVVIFNHGHWKINAPRGEKEMQLVANALLNASQHAVWKTTTATTTHRKEDSFPFIHMLHNFGLKIFDAYSGTFGMSFFKKAFFMNDVVHFQSFVHRELNIAFLEYLKQLLTNDESMFPLLGYF